MDIQNLLNSIFFPRKSEYETDDKDHLVSVDNDTSVGIRLFIKDVSYPTILFFHANAEITHEYDDIAEMYNQYNINFIVSGYRGYGISNGTPTMQSSLDDSLKIFSYVKEHLEKTNNTNKLILMGRSLGSTSTCHIMSNNEEKFDGAIIDSGFATEYPFLLRFGVDPESIDFKLTDGFNNLEKIKKYKKPFLIIHADMDEIIPFSQADIMFVESGSYNKDLFKVNGAGHNNVISIARDHYFSKIRDFIETL
ncbi:MAG: alpha/beta hydrolase [Candidatus Marinimicrobia bacterium]|nr:alpha/beta hydrolase [Candidatus Neomarinimicrobiota bacterium]